jgi:hypothetical protein
MPGITSDAVPAGRLLTDDETRTSEMEPGRGLRGKLMGVVQYRHQLKRLCEALRVPGVREVEVFDGPSGITQLKEWEEGVSRYFVGDTDGEVLKRYLNAVKNDLIVFAAVVEFETASDAALGDFTIKVTGHPSSGVDASKEFRLSVVQK